MLLTAVPFFVFGATWRLPDTYHSAGSGRGTATLKFYDDRDILRSTSSRSDTADCGKAIGGGPLRRVLGPYTPKISPMAPTSPQPHRSPQSPPLGGTLTRLFVNRVRRRRGVGAGSR